MEYCPTAADVTAGDGRQTALHERALAATWTRFDRRVFVRGVMDEERVLAAIAAEGLTPSRQSLAEFYDRGPVHARAGQTTT